MESHFRNILRIGASSQWGGFDILHLVTHGDQEAPAKMWVEGARPAPSPHLRCHSCCFPVRLSRPARDISTLGPLNRSAGSVFLQVVCAKCAHEVVLGSPLPHPAPSLLGSPLPSPGCSSCCLSGHFAALFWWNSITARSVVAALSLFYLHT